MDSADVGRWASVFRDALRAIEAVVTTSVFPDSFCAVSRRLSHCRGGDRSARPRGLLDRRSLARLDDGLRFHPGGPARVASRRRTCRDNVAGRPHLGVACARWRLSAWAHLQARLRAAVPGIVSALDWIAEALGTTTASVARVVLAAAAPRSSSVGRRFRLSCCDDAAHFFRLPLTARAPRRFWGVCLLLSRVSFA